MELTYVLRIQCSCSQKKIIDSVFDMKSSSSDDDWEMKLIEREADPAIDFFNIFLNLLENNYQNLSNIGIQREDISIWIYYQYDQQCNMEFIPSQMKRLGEDGITLCISCWQAQQDEIDETLSSFNEAI